MSFSYVKDFEIHSLKFKFKNKDDNIHKSEAVKSEGRKNKQCLLWSVRKSFINTGCSKRAYFNL